MSDPAPSATVAGLEAAAAKSDDELVADYLAREAQYTLRWWRESGNPTRYQMAVLIESQLRKRDKWRDETPERRWAAAVARVKAALR